MPGHVFEEPAGQSAEFEIALTLSTREPINYLEIIKDGHVEREVSFDEYRQGARLPKVRFDQSGWFLVRAVTAASKTYRFAMTGPYYVQIGPQPRISKRSAQFFLDWAIERQRQIEELEDAAQRAEVLKLHQKAPGVLGGGLVQGERGIRDTSGLGTRRSVPSRYAARRRPNPSSSTTRQAIERAGSYRLFLRESAAP